VARRSALVVLIGAFLLALAPAAHAQLPPPLFAFEHDESLDGTPDEIVSGFYGGGDDANGNGDPLDDRVPNSYETFEFTVPEGTQAGSFNVHVEWEEAQNDFDVYVYRKRPDGSVVPDSIASSAAFGDNDEDAGYRPALGNVEADTYLIVVDNWCTSLADEGASAEECGFGSDTENEDDFWGEVRLGPALISNPLPSVSLTGPASGTAGDTLTFTANATDDDPIENYAFDFNNDGRFETDNVRSNVVSHRFDSAGYYNVGVRVRDQDGDTAFASLKVVISGPATTIVSARGLLSSFKLNRPVFGGRKNRKLIVRYRLREPGRAVVSLYRGNKRVKRLASGNRRANRTYRITISPRKLRRGATYTVRMLVRSADGKRTQRVRLSAKRL
jgi:hypothetical protein